MAQLRALVTGVCGQDGSYLAEFLLEKGYEVHGFARRGSTPPDERVVMHFGDLTDPAALSGAIAESQPSEIYNLGAESHVGASFTQPEYTFRANAEPILTILEYVRQKLVKTRVYQASTSEMYGVMPPPQDEHTSFAPQSPYAIAKCAAHHTVQLYRKAYGLYAVGGILFNHESPRRPPSFVTRKISRGVARIALGIDRELVLGNLEARRDWGYAPDYVRAMWLMLQQDDPLDYVIATGETHSVSDFVALAFHYVEEFTGKALNINEHVRVDNKFKRPAEVPDLCGDASRAEQKLGWTPSVRFGEIVRRMIQYDLEHARVI